MKVAIITVAAILLPLALWYIATCNRFAKLRSFVQESWQ